MGCITWSSGGLYHEESSTTHTSSHLRQGGQVRQGQSHQVPVVFQTVQSSPAQARQTIRPLPLHTVTGTPALATSTSASTSISHHHPLRPTLLYSLSHLPTASTSQQPQPIYSYSLSHSSCFSLSSLYLTSKQLLSRIPFTIVSLISFNQFTRHW